ncbi:MAG: hypothetical protein V3G42_08645 [Oscillospiraceae bacterium]
MKAEKFNHPLLNMMNSPSSAADVWTRKQPETDTENKESVGDVNLPPVHTYDELKKMRRNAYIKMVAIVGIIVTALAFGSVAWFTESREVEGSSMQMTAEGYSFLIESIAKDANNVPGVKGAFYQGIHTLLNVPDNQIWMVLNDENMENYASSAEGIGPGAEGQLSFYFTPRVDSIDVNYTFKITGYQAVESTNFNTNTTTITDLTEIDADDQTNGDLANLLNGHILLFSDRSGTAGNYIYKGFIGSNNDMERIMKNVNYSGLNTKQKVTIYWVWPKTLSRLIEVNTSENVSVICDKTTLYDDDGNVTTDVTKGKTTYQRVVAHIEQNPQYYMKDSTGTVQSSDIESSYADYGDKYDLADNRIGAAVDYVVLKMSVTSS